MNPEGIAGGKTAGIPNLLLIGGVVLVVYFLFFRNSQSAANGESTGGGGTITTGDTTIGTGAVQVSVTQSGATRSGSGAGGAGGGGGTTGGAGGGKPKKPKRTRHHKKPKVPKNINPGGPIRRHPQNENTRNAQHPQAIHHAQPQPPVHKRRKAVHFLHDGKK